MRTRAFCIILICTMQTRALCTILICTMRTRALCTYLIIINFFQVCRRGNSAVVLLQDTRLSRFRLRALGLQGTVVLLILEIQICNVSSFLGWQGV